MCSVPSSSESTTPSIPIAFFLSLPAGGFLLLLLIACVESSEKIVNANGEVIYF